MATGRPTRAEQDYAPLAARFEANAYPSPEGPQTVFFRDVTAERRAEASLAERRGAAARGDRADDRRRLGRPRPPRASFLFHNTKGEEIIGHALIPSRDTRRLRRLRGAPRRRPALTSRKDYPIARAMRAGEVIDREPMALPARRRGR